MSRGAASPGPGGAAGALADVATRAAREDFDQWWRRGEATGWCSRPVRLAGSVRHVDRRTGEVREPYTTDKEPDEHLLVACKDRRAAVCPQCSSVYRADAYQLVAAGMRGGKGVPETVAEHPTVFLTLTAPSFGAVHSRRGSGRLALPCRPSSPRARCRHGQRTGCWERHDINDPSLGEPICPHCFDYVGAALWNAHLSALWHRTVKYALRALGDLVGLSARQITQSVHFAYVKVAEFQLRGSVHLHAVVRLDDAASYRSGQLGPPHPSPLGAFTAEHLAEALRRAADRVSVPLPSTCGESGASTSEEVSATVKWGEQLDVRPVPLGRSGRDSRDCRNTGDGRESVGVGDDPGMSGRNTQGEPSPKLAAVAGYLAKYATKSTDAIGGLVRPLTPETLENLDDLVRPHLAQLVRTCWELGGHAGLERLRRWAHLLGYGGHFATKSRRYSTTFGALREARAVFAREQREGAALDAFGRDLDQARAAGLVEVSGAWRFLAVGWLTPGDAWLAETAAARARERRFWGRVECTGAPLNEAQPEQTGLSA